MKNDTRPEIKTEPEAVPLLEKYEAKKQEKLDDCAAFQAVVCILCSAAVFALNFILPETAKELIGLVKLLSADENELFRNPIETILSLIDKL